MATSTISPAFEQTLGGFLLKTPPSEMLFSKWHYDTLQGTPGGFKSTAMDIRVKSYATGTKYTDATGYAGTGSVIGSETITYDFDWTFSDYMPASSLNNCPMTEKQFAVDLKGTYEFNYADLVTKRCINQLNVGAGNTRVIKPASAGGTYKDVVVSLREDLSTVRSNCTGWQGFSMTVVLNEIASNAIINSIASGQLREVQNSIVIKDGVVTKFDGCECIIAPDSIMKSNYEWNNASIPVYEATSLSKGIMYFVIVNNIPNRPVFVVDECRVKVEHRQATNKDGFENVGRVLSCCQVVEANKKGVAVALYTDPPVSEANDNSTSVIEEEPKSNTTKSNSVI